MRNASSFKSDKSICSQVLRVDWHPPPLIATTLFADYGTGYAIAIFIAACAVVSLVSAAFMPDYTGKDVSQEYDRRT